MKKALVLLVLFLAACASSPSTDVIDKRTFRCGPGQDIEVRAGVDDGSISREIAGELKYLVEVANNARKDITVTHIRINPVPKFGEKIEGLDSSAKAFDQLIPENEEHVFELPAIAFGGQRGLDRRVGADEIEFRVVVSLSNGDSYHCSFLAKMR